MRCSDGTLDEKELSALWDTCDKDKNGAQRELRSWVCCMFIKPCELGHAGMLDRDELRKLYIDMHNESIAKIKGGMWEIQKAMICPCNPICW